MGSASNPEPSIITAAPPVQNQQLIQLQLQQQQQQLQNLQLQQLQFQQQQLQQQLAQLKVASSSSQVYTTVAYSNEDSKPAASELRNVTLNQSNQLLGNAASDEDYASEEEPEEDEDDDRGISGVTVTFPVEIPTTITTEQS
uniref:(northern house mosquito) hypothetical protein n=1 Tax=Culex pipiens TaxID=7175 RepID=A0A8D8G1C4_CULPI